jgi:hypothetical protein
MEYYSAIKRNGFLIKVTTCMNLEIIKLNERSQTRKVTVVYEPFHVTCGQSHWERKQMNVYPWMGVEVIGEWCVLGVLLRWQSFDSRERWWLNSIVNMKCYWIAPLKVLCEWLYVTWVSLLWKSGISLMLFQSLSTHWIDETVRMVSVLSSIGNVN